MSVCNSGTRELLGLGLLSAVERIADRPYVWDVEADYTVLDIAAAGRAFPPDRSGAVVSALTLSPLLG